MTKYCTLLFLLYTTLTNAQVYTGNVWLTTQSAVDSFPINYPGVQYVAGSMIIGRDDTVNLSSITDLTPLLGLKRISGLYISNNGQLTNLSGLDSLTETSPLYVYNNPALTTLVGLHHLRSTDVLVIRKNASLPNLQGLNSMQEAYAVVIERCDNLLNLIGLDSLNDVFTTITIKGNRRLKSLEGMQLIDRQTFSIYQNDSLTQIGPFPSLKRGGLQLRNNANLSNLDGFLSYPSLTLNLSIEDNPKLIDLSGLRLTRSLSMGVFNNPSLTEISGLDSIEYLSATIESPNLSHIDFSAADTIGLIEIRNCSRLKHLDNFVGQADTVLYGIHIHHNDSLQTIHADEGPTYIRHLRIQDNPQLRSVTGFNAVKRSWMPTPAYYNCYECGIFITAPDLERVVGFESLTNGQIFIRESEFQQLKLDRVVGFNGTNGVFSTINLEGAKTIIGFSNTVKVLEEVYLYPQDTLGGFEQLATIQQRPDLTLYVNNSRFIVATDSNCYRSPLTFANLSSVEETYFSNSSFKGPLFKFPSLTTARFSSIHTSYNSDIVGTPFEGVYPNLTECYSFSVSDCPRFLSLDGIENISLLSHDPNNPISHYIRVANCDSLSDCSAVCHILNNATFDPPVFLPAYLDNPILTCRLVSLFQILCDTFVQVLPPVPDASGSAAATLRAWPNPVHSDYLNLSVDDPTAQGMYQVQVADASGRVALSGQVTFSAGEATLNVSMLDQGAWFLSLRRAGEPARGIRFVKGGG
jgi:hypothetical protein